jgi:hypothetical protein
MSKKSDKKKNPSEVERYFASDNRPANVGRNSTTEFSVDGKSFNYRDPRNPESNDYARAERFGDDGGAEDNRSKNAYEYTNPLYDYSYGQVRDAAKELDIGNVNSQEEVDQLLKQIRGGNKSKAEDFKDDFIEKKITPARENSDTEVEIPTGATAGRATAGDNSIASSTAQNNDIDIAGNRNTVDQDNSDEKKQAGNFLDKYKLSLNSGKGLNLDR